MLTTPALLLEIDSPSSRGPMVRPSIARVRPRLAQPLPLHDTVRPRRRLKRKVRNAGMGLAAIGSIGLGCFLFPWVSARSTPPPAPERAPEPTDTVQDVGPGHPGAAVILRIRPADYLIPDDGFQEPSHEGS